MASSSMCGPSNPLQQLKNHTSVDRSAQQDRFRPSAGIQPSTQFRHQQPGAQALDHEFEQFLGTPPGPSQLAHAPLRTQRSISPALQQAAWANDFQRLQINTPPAAAVIQQKPSAVFSGWGAEFLQQMNTPTAAPIAANPPALQQHQTGMLGYNNMNSGYMGMSSYASGFQTGPSTQQGVELNTTYTDAEFDQMFEQAAAAQQFDQKEMMDFPQREAPRPMQEARSQIEEVRPEELQQEKQGKDHERDDADELARTAKQLFETLSQDKSEKFQNSQFVAFMQKLGEKTVRLEDGKMVEIKKEQPPVQTERGDADIGRHGFGWPEMYDSGCRMSMVFQ